MTPIRVWHSSRDVYHCMFRVMRILSYNSEPIAIERLRLLDMFLLYPSLLHRVSLPLPIKDQFRQLKIAAPHDLFIRLPSTASVWQDLQIYQSTTIANLAARGILKKISIEEGQADIDLETAPPELRNRLNNANAEQNPLMNFLVYSLSALPMSGREGLARRSALPSRGVAL